MSKRQEETIHGLEAALKESRDANANLMATNLRLHGHCQEQNGLIKNQLREIAELKTLCALVEVERNTAQRDLRLANEALFEARGDALRLAEELENERRALSPRVASARIGDPAASGFCIRFDDGRLLAVALQVTVPSDLDGEADLRRAPFAHELGSQFVAAMAEDGVHSRPLHSFPVAEFPELRA